MMTTMISPPAPPADLRPSAPPSTTEPSPTEIGPGAGLTPPVLDLVIPLAAFPLHLTGIDQVPWSAAPP